MTTDATITTTITPFIVTTTTTTNSSKNMTIKQNGTKIMLFYWDESANTLPSFNGVDWQYLYKSKGRFCLSI